MLSWLLQGALDGGLDIPHSEKRFVGYNAEEKKLDPEARLLYSIACMPVLCSMRSVGVAAVYNLVLVMIAGFSVIRLCITEHVCYTVCLHGQQQPASRQGTATLQWAAGPATYLCMLFGA